MRSRSPLDSNASVPELTSLAIGASRKKARLCIARTSPMDVPFHILHTPKAIRMAPPVPAARDEATRPNAEICSSRPADSEYEA